MTVRWLGWGALAAALVAGPSLYDLLQRGAIDGTAALLRWGVVALGVTAGLSLLGSLMDGYRSESERAGSDETDEDDGPPGPPEERRARA